MHRLRNIFLGSILGIAMLAQNASLMMNPDVKRVGMKLACLCGACKNSVGDCPMIGCHYAIPGREKIEQMQKTGMQTMQKPQSLWLVHQSYSVPTSLMLLMTLTVLKI